MDIFWNHTIQTPETRFQHQHWCLIIIIFIYISFVNNTNYVGSSQRGKKRNSSLQESSESPSKKSKLESSSKAQTQKLGTLKDDKSCSLRQQRKTAALSKQASKEERHAADQIKVIPQYCTAHNSVHNYARTLKTWPLFSLWLDSPRR